MRSRFALAAYIAGVPHELGASVRLTGDIDPAIVAFALLDHADYGLAHKPTDSR